MPIRVECPKCGDVTHFADNDANLIVSCLICRNRLKVVPAVAVAKPAVVAAARPPQSKPAASSPAAAAPLKQAALATASATSKPAPARASVAAAPSGRWRTYSILAIVIAGAGVAIWRINDRGTPAAIAQSDDKQSSPTPATTRPTTRPTAAVQFALANPTPAKAADPATPAKPADPKAAAQPAAAPIPPATPVTPPPPPAPAPVLVSTYTPVAAPVGFVGVDRIDLGGQYLIDSYNAAAAPYAPATAADRAPILTNGPITITGQGQLRGVVHIGEPASAPRPTPSAPAPAPAPNAPVTMLYAPPVMLDPFTDDSMNDTIHGDFLKAGNLVLPAKTTLELQPGVYYLADLNVADSAVLKATGPVTLLVSGHVTLAGTIETPDNRPANLRLRVTGEQAVTLNGTTPLFMDLYAPGSAIDIAGKGDLHGSIVGKTLKLAGTRAFHFDESLTPPPAAGDAH